MQFGSWLVTGTPVGEPYPCRCAERRFSKCSAVFCPCAGRLDPPNAECCAHVNTPEKVVQEGIAYRIRKMRERAGVPQEDP